MGDTPEKIQWHSAFCAATELEFEANIESLELKSEYNLSKEPIRIDLLIINHARGRLQNEIGHLIKRYNIIEYKSPEDGLTIDDFYKTIGYACLYKGYGDYVNQISLDELTVSLFRERYPRKMFLTLKEHGHKIERKYPGIYYIYNNLPFPVQVIVTQQLSKENHRSLRVLSAQAQRDDVEDFLKSAEKLRTPRQRNNIDAVLQVSVSANYKLYREIRRKFTMCEALRELMKDEIEKDVNDAYARGESKGVAKGEASIIKRMFQKGFSTEQIADATDLSIEKVEELLSRKETVVS